MKPVVFQVVFLKNRGVLVGGESIEEAFHLLRRVMNAVDTQVCCLRGRRNDVETCSFETWPNFC